MIEACKLAKKESPSATQRHEMVTTTKHTERFRGAAQQELNLTLEAHVHSSSAEKNPAGNYDNVMTADGSSAKTSVVNDPKSLKLHTMKLEKGRYEIAVSFVPQNK